ncbi:uncharacterized protein ATC70_006573 [Mucor velutinosus]|uniref:Uncharacterized protein n=1 Tax=Mucor velutinosus TaxID=708070 RepID=A0AAN7DSV9_9FUNG|nr:hypothetical protein ATC70_006573 [Mucor velutinosus]
MTKSKSTVLLQSRREPTLESKSIADKRVLFGNNQQQSMSAPFTEPWLDPNILCKSNAYQITVNCKLPERYQTIIHRELGKFLRVKASLQAEYMALLTTTHFYLYLKKSHRHIAHPMAHLYKEDSINPLFDIFLQTDNTIQREDEQVVKILTVDSRGKAILFVHYDGRFTQAFYDIPLYQPYEYITAVKWIHADQALIGSSTGQAYLLNSTATNTQHRVMTLCKQSMPGPWGFMKSLYTASLPHASECTLPKIEESGSIVNISTVDNMVYMCSHHQVCVWIINNTEAQLVARIPLQNDIVNCISQHVPSDITKSMLQCRIVTMDIEIKEELVLLVSYTVPGLSEYVQYAVIKFSMIHSNDTIMMYPQHTASLPYSEIPSPSSKIPQLNITKDIAFASFDGTVVARSLSKKSVFEESLVLKDKENAILAVHVTDSSESFDTAKVVTAKSDVLEFQVNKSEIQGPGNIYAGIVDDVVERNTMVFKSRLEQALFFGVFNESPLQFPLAVEHHEDVGSAVMDLTREIRTGACSFLPKMLEISPIESRFYFQNHMYKILQDQMLDRFLSAEQRSQLFELLELYYLSKQLWKITLEKSADMQWMDTVTQISQAVLLQTTDQPNTKSQQWADFLTHHIDKIKDFLSQISTNNVSSCADDIIPRIIQKCRSFEDINLPRYSIQQPPKNNFSAKACKHLVSIFDQKVAHYTISCPDNGQKAKLRDMATLLLDIHRQQPYTEEYDDMKKTVFKGLCAVGLHQAVVDLADKHNDITFIVISVPHLNLSPEEFRQTSRHFVDRFGYPYFESLLQQLDVELRENIWYFCEQYPAFTETFFSSEQQHLPKVAWIYHVKKGNYKKAHEVLSRCSGHMSEKEHCLASPWIKMLSVVLEGKVE